MDSTADDDSRNSKRARLAPGPGGDVDRISGLDDDVLLHILGLVADAKDAVRTGALSRRWRGLWTRVPALCFASRSASTADLERFVSFVNGVLARRSQSDCAIESLVISYSLSNEHSSLGNRMPWFLSAWQRVISPPCPIYTDSTRHKLMPTSVDAVQAWIRYAVQHSVKSLDVDLSLPPAYYPPKHWRDRNYGGGEEKPAVFLGDLHLPTGTTSPVIRLETMRLALGGAGFRLSAATVKFASLTVLSLEKMEMPAGGVRRLARLVSPAGCPRLQKLSLRMIGLDALDDEMRLEAKVLSELVIVHVQPLTSLKLRTPSLRVLHLDTCCYELLSISAPRLEQVALLLQLRPSRSFCWLHVDGGDLPCVRRAKICLWSHRDRASVLGEAENNCSIQLLKHCNSLTCLDVTLEGQKECDLDVDMIKRRVPQLPRVTSLIIKVSVLFVKRHIFGASVASLLTRFNNLRHLSLHLPFFADLTYNFLLCDHPNHWINEFSMGHLQEAEFTGFTGIDCELWFIKAMLTSTKRLHKVAISFNKYYGLPQRKMDALERLLLGGGMWTSHRDTYMLTCIR